MNTITSDMNMVESTDIKQYKITIILSESEQIIFDVDAWFDNSYEDVWFSDPFICEMIKDVDKSEVKSAYCIENSVLGQIPPTLLSGGIKALVLMYKTDLTICATNCGDNCIKWIKAIADKKPITIALGHLMDFNSKNLHVYVKDLDTVYTDSEALLMDLVLRRSEYCAD